MRLELYEDNQKVFKQVCELLRMAFYFKQLGHDLFIDYAAHVNQITVKLFIGGWKEDKQPDFWETAYIMGSMYDEEYFNDLISVLRYKLRKLENERDVESFEK